MQHSGDLFADPSTGSGDDRDLAGQRLLPIRYDARGGRAGGADTDDLTGDVGGLGGEQESQGRGESGVRGAGDVDQLNGGAAADFLAQGPGEPFEGTLGDSLGGGVRGLRGSAEDDHARARGEVSHQRTEELL